MTVISERRRSVALGFVASEETDAAFILNVELGDASAEGLRVEVTRRQLTVVAGRTFRRDFTLPPDTDAERIEAVCRDGILQLRIPKAKPWKSRRVPVRTDAPLFSETLARESGPSGLVHDEGRPDPRAA